MSTYNSTSATQHGYVSFDIALEPIKISISGCKRRKIGVKPKFLERQWSLYSERATPNWW